MTKLYVNTLDLITRQQEEIENLKVEKQSLRTAANSLRMHYEEAQAEIESLKTQNAVIMKQALAENKTTATAIMAETKQHIMTAEKIKRLEEEIDRLQIAQFQFISEINAYKGKLKTAKSEAVEEFAERLKEDWQANDYYWEEADVYKWIDNLLKEMAGENNA